MSAAQITQVVTAMPTPPDTASPSTFSDRAVATAAAQADLVTELNTVITQANALSTQVNSESTSAAADAATATTKAAEATASALTAVNAPGTSATSTTSLAIQTTLPASISMTIQTGKSIVVGMRMRIAYTTSPANYMEGDVTAYNSGTGALTVNVTNSQGTGTYAAWTVSLAPAALTTVTNSVQTKTGAFTAYATDIGKVFDCTGTFTITLDLAATLGDGWYIYVKSTGTVTIDPNGSELIDGASTADVGDGSAAMVICTGSAFKTIRSRSTGYIHVREQQASGTSPGTSSVGVNVRTLNTTVTNTITGASLSSNVVTLPPGTYDFEAYGPTGSTGTASGAHRLTLYNHTDSADIMLGPAAMLGHDASGASASYSGAVCFGRFTLTASKGVKLNHYFAQTAGLGTAASTGQSEVYASLQIWKVA